jgi:hypothetical protein
VRFETVAGNCSSKVNKPLFIPASCETPVFSTSSGLTSSRNDLDNIRIAFRCCGPDKAGILQYFSTSSSLTRRRDHAGTLNPDNNTTPSHRHYPRAPLLASKVAVSGAPLCQECRKHIRRPSRTFSLLSPSSLHLQTLRPALFVPIHHNPTTTSTRMHCIE